ncbi:MAG: hypothetical protein ABIK46_04715, partial [candidate division WOR-3 bacterium]
IFILINFLNFSRNFNALIFDDYKNSFQGYFFYHLFLFVFLKSSNEFVETKKIIEIFIWFLNINY